jgi:TolB-like protein
MKKFLLTAFLVFTAALVFSQQKPVVAVAPFDAISGISATDVNMITRVFYIRLGNTNRVTLVDRTVVERVIREHDFQLGDWSNPQKTAEFGNALNADWIVRGEMETFGSTILVTVSFYDIRTFQFKGGADLRLANAEEAYDKIDPLVEKLMATIAENPAPAPALNIGDRGPGGGFIFFAENGVYMECSMDIGSYSWDAAVTAAQNYRGGGFSDWRLPSIGELELMYNNLKTRNLGGFSGDYYWSSSGGSENALDFSFRGRRINLTRNISSSVRAVRQFQQ